MTAGRTNSNQLSVEWCTPPVYVERVHLFFKGKLELDPCSNLYSLIQAKIKYMLPANDGLLLSWNFKSIFCNPPYGRNKETKTTIRNWIERCYTANKRYNSEVLALIPVATNTTHWKEYIFGKAELCFLYDTRLKFCLNGVQDVKGAPMACAMVHWGEKKNRFKNIFSEFGYCTY